MVEIKISTRELKNKLNEYLRRVKTGETITVTEHGKTIGQITPVKTSVEERIQFMVRSGQATWNGHKLGPYRAKVINKSERMLSDLIGEERE